MTSLNKKEAKAAAAKYALQQMGFISDTVQAMPAPQPVQAPQPLIGQPLPNAMNFS